MATPPPSPALRQGISRWIAVIGIVGLAGISLSFWLYLRQQVVTSSQIRIGQVENVTGQVWILSPGYEKKRRVERYQPILPRESIETEETGEARLLYDNGAVIRVFPESLVLLEHDLKGAESVETLVVQRGEIHVDESGHSGDLLISKNGTRVAASEYQKLALAQEPVDHPLQSQNTSKKNDQTLSEDEISTVMTGQRSHFMKCFTTLLQKSPEAKGQVTLNFTIENSGRVGISEIQASQLKDDEFRKCILNVLQRTEFRGFTGAPITTLFPLQFE